MLRRVVYSTPARASFSTSSTRQVDLSNLYSKLTGWRRKTPKEAPVDPTKVRESERSDTGMHTDSKPRKLEILGQPKKVEEDWPEVQQYAEFTPWPTNQHRKDLTKEQIASVLNSIKDLDFRNIEARFAAVKSISEQLSLAIPDAVFTKLNSTADLENHLHKSAVPFDERQPDAVYLNPEDFVGLNITLSDPVAERRSRKRRTHEVIKEAKAAQKRATDELMRG